jgi:hypothetical protein
MASDRRLYVQYSGWKSIIITMQKARTAYNDAGLFITSKTLSPFTYF